MLTTLAFLGIFTEIFASGILLSGIYTFFKKFLEDRDLKDLALSLIFLCFSSFTIMTILSQIFYDLDRKPSDLILLQKLIEISLLIGSYLLVYFLKEKIGLKFNWVMGLLALPVLFLIGQIIMTPDSSTTLNYHSDVLEPLVTFGNIPALSRPLFTIIWGFGGLIVFIRSFFENKGKRSLSLLFAFSCLLFIVAYLLTMFYVNLGDNIYLVLSWAAILFGALGIFLSELIPVNSIYAGRPIGFLRSRILFRLIFIFVLLIVVLFGVTTLVTLTLSKQALYTSIINNYKEIAQSTASKVDELGGLDQAALQKLVNEKTSGMRMVYVVDRNGKVIAHADVGRIGSSVAERAPIALALSGKTGGGQFPPDEFGQENAGAYAPIRKFGGAVIVEEPLRQAYVQMRLLETNSLLFAIAGIILTVLTGIFFAQSIERSIRQLIHGTEAVSKGDLNTRINIDSADEIGMLATAFNKMTKDLKDSQERLILSEKLASLGTMAAGMAHEIKNPLVSLRTFSQLIQQKWDDPEFRTKFAQIVPNEIERINKIAESLLKFGRPVKPELTKINVNNILDEIMMLFESECKKNNIRVTTKLAELPEITGDAQQLSQAFVNIILNAIQAMEETKGGELTIKTDIGEVVKIGRPSHTGVETEKGEIVWEAEETQPAPIPVVFIEITDTGPGIDSEKIKSLFDPFYTTKMKGTGMGLPITLRIIEEHMGSIKVKSRTGKGTTFIITLPQRMDQV
ncbi:MAG TPA: ATP-binding protein [Candidatus Omnitrophota bacterium]|nr:ATP-binding protein [Candidatus Omnitrophota bacterium]